VLKLDTDTLPIIENVRKMLVEQYMRYQKQWPIYIGRCAAALCALYNIKSQYLYSWITNSAHRVVVCVCCVCVCVCVCPRRQKYYGRPNAYYNAGAGYLLNALAIELVVCAITGATQCATTTGDTSNDRDGDVHGAAIYRVYTHTLLIWPLVLFTHILIIYIYIYIALFHIYSNI
jgi:hypothetical protein